MNLAIAAGAMMFFPIRTMLAVSRDAGADGVELMATPMVLRRGPVAIQGISTEIDIPILSVHARLFYRWVPLRKQIDSDRASIAFAAAMRDCECIVLHPPIVPESDISSIHRWLDAITSERDRSRSSLKLAIENRPQNFDGTPRQLLDNLERLRILAGEWGVHVTFDVAHAASFGIDIVSALDIVAPRIANVHLSDAGEGRYRGGITNGLLRDHQVPGHGRLDLQRIVSRLGSTAPDTLLTIELSPLSARAYLPLASRRALTNAVTTTRQYIQVAKTDEHSVSSPRRQARSSG